MVVPTQEAMMAGNVPVETSTAVMHEDVALTDVPHLSKFLFCVCCPNPLAWAASITKVDQNEQQAVLYWGQYMGSLTEPGLHCTNPCGRELRKVSTKSCTLELKDIKVVDARGNPVIISGVVTYKLNSAKRACVDVEAPTTFITLQATTSMKQVASRYPYVSRAGEPSLQTEGASISAELIRSLQEKAAITGAHIMNFELVDLSYAPEIAQVMLVKQQAEALVEARRLIVGSAVTMTQDAVAQLEAKGQKLSDNAKETLTTNLLAVICSHQPAVPTVSMASGSRRR
jgi:regulator of protease activity HflC (stomatin/prohibitin superfamily)